MKILLFILLLATLLRFINLPNIPTLDLRNDEAALGYNAYSILQTGKDEHGEFLPIIFQSFGDWKPGLYIYLAAPFVALLGLTEGAVRMPSILSGVIAVAALYFIVFGLFKDRKLAILSAFFLSISPWHINFSRGAWEANVSLTLMFLGVIFFLKSIKKPKFLIPSSIFFGLTLLTSHGAKLSTPIMLFILTSIFYKEIIKIPKKYLITAFIVGLVITSPIIFSFSEGKVGRINTLSIFSYPQDSGIGLLKSIMHRYFDHFTISTLFLRGDGNPQHVAPNVGPFLFLDFFLSLAGLMVLIRNEVTQQTLFIFLSLLLLPLPSSLTIESVNFERSPTMLIPWVIIISVGASVALKYISKFKISIATFLIGFLYLINYIYFLDQFFIHKIKQDNSWQHKKLVETVTPYQDKYENIFIQQSLEHPYIFFLFYQKYDPKKYQSVSGEVFIPNSEGKDMGQVVRLNNLYFEEINWLGKNPESGDLYVMPVSKMEEYSKEFKNYRILEEMKDKYGVSYYAVIKII